jgi:hypothetical protein
LRGFWLGHIPIFWEGEKPKLEKDECLGWERWNADHFQLSLEAHFGVRWQSEAATPLFTTDAHELFIVVAQFESAVAAPLCGRTP